MVSLPPASRWPGCSRIAIDAPAITRFARFALHAVQRSARFENVVGEEAVNRSR